MAASYNFADYADGTAYWYTEALVTSTKLHQMTVNEKTVMDYLYTRMIAGGKTTVNFADSEGTIVFNDDNQFGTGYGEPNFVSAPTVYAIFGAAESWYVLNPLNVTAIKVDLYYALGLTGDWTVHWLAIGTGQMS